MERLDRIEKILEENAIQQAKNDKLFAELRISQAETSAMFKETDAKFKETDIKFKETDAKFKVTEAQMAETNTTLKKIGVLSGNTARNLGFVTEDYFYNSLSDKMKFGGIKYDKISKNIHTVSKKLEDEFDVVMYNGNSIALIECKYKAHKSDVEKLMTKKVENFRLLHPDFANYKIYLGIGSFGFYDELETFAKENGVAILKQKGEITEIDDKNLKVY
jgi:hypothetical protein